MLKCCTSFDVTDPKVESLLKNYHVSISYPMVCSDSTADHYRAEVSKAIDGETTYSGCMESALSI